MVTWKSKTRMAEQPIGRAKWEYDSQGNVIYFENSKGKIIDNRPKSCEGKIVEFDGEKFKLVKV
jgi:hypothetical protein